LLPACCLHHAAGCEKQERLKGDKTVMCIGGNKIKTLFWGVLFLALVIAVPVSTMAEIDDNVSIALPPPILFEAPPELIVLPETYVYAVPDVDADIFFYNGLWWRPWEGRWYRSRYYDSDWGFFQDVPPFYKRIPSGWRDNYRKHRWGGLPWNYKRIPHQQLQQNWKDWENNRFWEKEQTWDVQGLKHQTQSQQPSRKAKPEESGLQLKEVTPERSHHHHHHRYKQETHERRGVEK